MTTEARRAAPGGPAALASGCRCSVLANAAYRAGAPNETPLIDPLCPLHVVPEAGPRALHETDHENTDVAMTGANRDHGGATTAGHPLTGMARAG